jgi:hypothetical protein
MTDQEVAEPERPIMFNGREMYVWMPRPEQLLVWRRTLRRLQDMEENDWTADEVMKALERTRKIIDSVLVNETDKDWLDDQMLDRKLTLKDTGGIIQLTVEAFADAAKGEGNRQTKRAAKKVAPKKAAR